MRALIVDNEKHCCETLQTMLERHCPEIKNVRTSMSGAEGLDAIRQERPDLLFLDVEMPEMNGFEMLEKLSSPYIDVIFTTGHDEYVLKALRFGALDYLLKPVDREELQHAVRKASTHSQTGISEQIEILLNRLKQPQSSFSRIALPTMDGLHMITINQIISCESSSNYTVVKLKGGQKITVSRTLKDIEELLEENHFLRIHHSHVANLNEIVKYIKGDGGYIVMSDGSSVDVSRGKKEILLRRLQPKKVKSEK